MNAVVVDRLAAFQEGGRWRSQAWVNEAPLWFETPDAGLRPTPEAFAGVALVPALHHQAPVEVDAPLSAAWLQNAHRLMEIFGEWWGYRPIAIHHQGEKAVGQPAPGRTALNFSCGVDAFYSLLECRPEAEVLVTINGMLPGWRNPGRYGAFRERCGEVARTLGKDHVLIQTNAGDHPVFSSVSLGRTHGSLLAAAGHLLEGVRRLVNSATYPVGIQDPWGTHWKTDPLWGCDDLEILYVGGDCHRYEKILRIADNPLVRTNLNVCLRNRDSLDNCCRCEKCLRTMIVVAAAGALEEFETFPEKDRIAASLDAIPLVPKDELLDYGVLVKVVRDPAHRAALERLLTRSRRRYSRIRKMGRKVRRKIGKAFPRLGF